MRVGQSWHSRTRRTQARRARPAGGRRPRRGAPAGGRRRRPQDGPSAGGRRPPADVAGLSVQIGFWAHLGTAVEQTQVRLDSTIRRPPGVQAKAFPRARDILAAARRIARHSRPEATAGLLDALAHGQRLRILLELLGGEATHRLLAKVTGLKAGPLYHHVRELRSAGLIGPKVRDLYVLTPKGRRAILGSLALERLCR